MAEILHKILDCEVKKLNDFTFEFTASTEDIDRDGEVIEAKGWDLKNFKKNPVIMYGHDYHGLPIGKSPKVWVSDKKLKNHVEFPPEGTYEFADIVRRLVDGGFLKTESVGFKPAPDSIVEEDGDGIKAPRRRYTKQELLEISIVPVPSNPNALLEAKAKGIINDKELELITKPEETENYIRIPVKGEEGKHEGHRIRTIEISADKGIKALYCGQDKVVITYLFDKDKKWTMETAQTWVREHGKIVANLVELPEKPIKTVEERIAIEVEREIPQPKPVSQGQIKDEIDYLLTSIKQVGISDENKEMAKALSDAIRRITGSDIPVEDKKKEFEPPKHPSASSFTLEDIKGMVKEEIGKMVRKAQGKLN